MLKQKADFVARYFHNQELSLLKWAQQKELELSKVVVQIPARMNSSRLKNKNVMDLCGKPLLAYTAQIAKQLRGVDQVIINTDSAHYASIAEQYGVNAPFLRPAELAKDHSSITWATYYLVRHFVDADYPLKAIITLMPTSPFRNLNAIQHLVDQLLANGAAYTALRADAMLSPYADENGHPVLQGCAPRTGCLPAKTLGNFSGELLIKKNIEKCCIQYIDDPVELIDIDTKQDFEMAKYVLENDLYDFGL